MLRKAVASTDTAYALIEAGALPALLKLEVGSCMYVYVLFFHVCVCVCVASTDTACALVDAGVLPALLKLEVGSRMCLRLCLCLCMCVRVCCGGGHGHGVCIG